jgi:hypothetical protein
MRPPSPTLWHNKNASRTTGHQTTSIAPLPDIMGAKMVGYAMEAGLLTHRGRSGGSDTTQSVAWRYYQYDLHQTKQHDMISLVSSNASCRRGSGPRTPLLNGLPGTPEYNYGAYYPAVLLKRSAAPTQHRCIRREDLETNTLLFASYLAPNHRVAVICICIIHLVSSESLPRRIAPAKAFVHSSLSPSPSCPTPPLEPLGLW